MRNPAVDVQPFWKTKTLDEMSKAEWESLCDGCARCCLIKLEDEDTGEVHLTRLACRLLDSGTCRCKDYANRHDKVPDCVAIDAAKVRSLSWLPATCAYRLLAEGKERNSYEALTIMERPDSSAPGGGPKSTGICRNDGSERDRA